MSNTKSGVVIHRNVSVIACDNSGTLKETLSKIAGLDLDAVFLGERHLVLPASQVPAVLRCLHEHGQFPRLIGDDTLLQRVLGGDEEPGTETATADMEADA